MRLVHLPANRVIQIKLCALNEKGMGIRLWYRRWKLLVRALAHPQARKPGNLMPDQNLSAEDVEAIATFLESRP